MGWDSVDYHMEGRIRNGVGKCVGNGDFGNLCYTVSGSRRATVCRTHIEV